MSDTILGLVAFGLVFLAATLLAAFSYLQRKSIPPLREVPAYLRLRRAIGRVVEDGSRLHVSLGRGALATPQSASALAGLALLRRLANVTAVSDRPPIATSGDGALALLSQSTLQGAAEDALQPYDASAGRLTGLTPFSYAAGAIPSIRDENVSTTVLMGNFGVESALLTDACERANVFCVGGSDNLAAQAVLYAGASDPLIGEELYSAGAYIEPAPLQTASLTVQDILRWLFIIVLVGGALLKAAGLL